MKTGIDRLKELLTPEEWEQFEANVSNDLEHIATEHPSEILLGAFTWEDSPQKHKYWELIHFRLVSDTFNPEPLQKERTYTLADVKEAFPDGYWKVAGLDDSDAKIAWIRYLADLEGEK